MVYGNLTRDPELKVLPSGMKIASFSLATNRQWKVDNEKKEEAEYHNIVAYGKTAEVIVEHMKKGSPLYVEGRIKTRSWGDDEKKYKTEIVVEEFKFGPRGQDI